MKFFVMFIVLLINCINSKILIFLLTEKNPFLENHKFSKNPISFKDIIEESINTYKIYSQVNIKTQQGTNTFPIYFTFKHSLIKVYNESLNSNENLIFYLHDKFLDGTLGYSWLPKVEVTGLKMNIEKTNSKELKNGIEIGMNLKNTKNYVNMNLIQQLKQKNYTSDYYWTIIYYDNSNVEPDYMENYPFLPDAALVIGESPEIFYSSHYTKGKSKKIYNAIIDGWGIKINNAFLLSEKNETQKFGYDNLIEFDFNLYINIGTTEYQNIIKTIFFNKLINNNICFEEQINYNNDKYAIITCNSQINEFPSIYFYVKEYKYIFEFGYVDLFKEIKGKYIFLIIFPINKKRINWKFGKTFLSKYRLSFNYDNKQIHFYKHLNTSIEINEQEKRTNDFDYLKTKEINNNNFYKNLSILLFIFLIFIIIFSFIYYRKKNLLYKNIEANKKRKNPRELKEQYDYFSNDSNLLDDDNKDINNEAKK